MGAAYSYELSILAEFHLGDGVAFVDHNTIIRYLVLILA
jgi:hypothetical protein